MANEFVWSSDAVERLKQLHNSYSNSQIAEKLSEEFGIPCTRNAVIGKVHRLGLQTKRPNQPPNIDRIRQVRERSRKPSVATVGPAPIVAAPPPSLALPPSKFEGVRPNIVTVRYSQCRWIMDERDEDNLMICCGHPVLLGSWCAEHALIVYPLGALKKLKQAA